MLCSLLYGSVTAAGLSQRFQTVFVSGDGSLDTAQWNFVMDCVTRFAAKVELMFWRQVVFALPPHMKVFEQNSPPTVPLNVVYNENEGELFEECVKGTVA
jgi:hypothetical protein